MSNVTTSSIRPVGPYPIRRPIADQPATNLPGGWTPGYPSMPGRPPLPPAPTMPAPPPVPGYGQYPTMPSYPVQPPVAQYPAYPTYPTYPQQPQYPGYPGQPRGVGGFLGDVWSGVKERSHEVGQMVLHPFNAQARRPYFGRNPWAPRTTGETVGRWLVNGTLIAGAFVGVRALLGGGFGGGAGVGMSNGLGKVVQIATAPFRWAGRAAGAMFGAVKDTLGGLFSVVGGGARVGMR
jgi:hypothetical protein